MNVTTPYPTPAAKDRRHGVPALLMRPGEGNQAIPPEPKLRTILVPIDFSAESEKALRYAVPLARHFGAHINLLYVSHVQLHGNEFAYLPIEEAGIGEAAKEWLNSIASRTIPPDLLGGTLVRHGVAFDQIVVAANELDADLIIVNTHGYTGLKHVLVGSTAELVIRHAPCPVLVVREREQECV